VARSISLALAAALDAPDLAWESGGDEAWSAQTTPSHDGTDAAVSGSVAPGQSSWLETTVTGPCNLRFRWEASQRQALDIFRLETGTGDPILLTSPGIWEERLVELPAGNHILRWVFARDAASIGASRVRLDAVSVTPATTPTVTTAAAASISGSGATLGGNVTADGGRTVTARGVVYSTTPEPSLTSPGSLAAASGGTGTFSVGAPGVAAGTTYHARAYATNHLGTAYGAEVVFTTDTTVPLTEGLGRVTDRPLLAGDTQRFRFRLAFPSEAAFTTTGLDAATWELRDGGGALVDSGSGNVDFGGLLLSGQYLLTVTSTGGTTQTFSLDLDASLEAVPKPDLSIGADPTAATGVGLYPPTPQSIAVLSRRGDPVTVFAKVANEGLLPDAMELRGSGGNSLCGGLHDRGEQRHRRGDRRHLRHGSDGARRRSGGDDRHDHAEQAPPHEEGEKRKARPHHHPAQDPLRPDRSDRSWRSHPIRHRPIPGHDGALTGEGETGWHFRAGGLCLRSTAEAEGFLVD